MDSSSISNESLLQDQSSSRFKRKLTFFITIIIIFTIIITAIISVFFILKHQINSQSLSSNPTRAIRIVCSLTPYYLSYNPEIYDRDLCTDSISPLHLNAPSKTNPSKIFALSLLAAINYFSEITSSTKGLIPNFKNEPAVRNCSDLFADSLTHLRTSLTIIGVDPDENLLRNKRIVGDVKRLISVAESDVEACLDWFRNEKRYEKMGLKQVRVNANMAKSYVSNNLVILESVDDIFDMFYPKIESVLGSFLFTFDSYFSLVLFCSQFLLLAALFGVFLRLHRR